MHWHGLALRNDQDGVPGVTRQPVAPAAEFTYRFTVPHPGTYWLHPHVGAQQDRGLYATLIVDASALALLRTASGAAPGPGVRPKELDGRLVGYAALTPTDAVRLPQRPAAPAYRDPVRQGERYR